jgi:transcriptional regulator GlxA family with amidase domain
MAGPAKRIGIMLFDGVEELDAVGPWEVLAYWTRAHPEDGWEVCLVGLGSEPVTAAKGMILTPQFSLADAPALDVLIQPGGAGTRPLMADDAYLAWIRGQAETTELMTSVCTGSLVYAAAGLLAGRPATTYWSLMDQLTAIDPSIEPRPDDRFVDDGDVITSAGVSAGIDMALHLVVRLVGRDRAVETRRGIQYDPAPPV